MTKNRTPEPDETRLEELEEDIEEVHEREERRRKEAVTDHMRFATPEAYEGEILEEEERVSETEAALKRATGEKKDRR